MKKLFVVPLLLAAASCSTSHNYVGPWRSVEGPYFDKIAVTLGKNHISGCGEFYYKLAEGDDDPGEALVYCTRNGVTWHPYVVFYNIEAVNEGEEQGEPPVSSVGTG